MNIVLIFCFTVSVLAVLFNFAIDFVVNCMVYKWPKRVSTDFIHGVLCSSRLCERDDIMGTDENVYFYDMCRGRLFWGHKLLRFSSDAKIEDSFSMFRWSPEDKLVKQEFKRLRKLQEQS